MSRHADAAWLCCLAIAITLGGWCSPSAKASPRPHAAQKVAHHQAPRSSAAPLPPAQPGGRGAVAADDALQLARAAWLETGFSVPDGRALVGVMRVRARRAGVSLTALALDYTALGRGYGVPRNDFGRQLPDGPVAAWSSSANARWRRLRAAVRAVVEGRAGTPCRGASHLGSLTEQPDVGRAERAIKAGKWRRVRCAQDVVHAYYAEI